MTIIRTHSQADFFFDAMQKCKNAKNAMRCENANAMRKGEKICIAFFSLKNLKNHRSIALLQSHSHHITSPALHCRCVIQSCSCTSTSSCWATSYQQFVYQRDMLFLIISLCISLSFSLSLSLSLSFFFFLSLSLSFSFFIMPLVFIPISCLSLISVLSLIFRKCHFVFKPSFH